jgi:hypothetical protein
MHAIVNAGIHWMALMASWTNAGMLQEGPKGRDLPAVGDPPRMRAMKDASHALRRNTHSRSLALGDRRAERFQKILDIRPDNIRSDRLLEDTFECVSLFCVHVVFDRIGARFIVLYYDTVSLLSSKPCPLASPGNGMLVTEASPCPAVLIRPLGFA